jgi:hypothetical protein
MMHPEISRICDRERRKEMLAAADRGRLASLVYREAPAARPARRIARHDSVVRREQILRKILLRRVWL